MKVAILCGGYGTRIRDVADNIPKPMIPIGRYPILWHIMRHYASYGHKDFILCLGYKAEVIKQFFLNYEALTRDFTIVLGSDGRVKFHTDRDETGWQVTLVDTGLEAMTGARLRKIKQHIGDDENFMLTYGDGVGDIAIDKLLAFHKAHGRTLTVTGVRPPGRFGELRADADGVVFEFNEKPQAAGGLISGGFFVCRRDIFECLGEGEDLMFEVGPMNQLVAARQLCVYQHEGFWQPMDTSRDYQLLNALYAKGNAPWVP